MRGELKNETEVRVQKGESTGENFGLHAAAVSLTFTEINTPNLSQRIGKLSRKLSEI